MNPSSEVFGWAILAATFLGPILAVLMTRYIDWKREARNRQLYVFRTLIQAWRAYFENLCTDPKDDRKIQRAIAERPSLLAKLLYEIGNVVGYPIEQLDIMAGGYTPQAVYNTAQRQEELQSAAIELLSGKKALLVKNMESVADNEAEFAEISTTA
jgi:hypothetical protein